MGCFLCFFLLVLRWFSRNRGFPVKHLVGIFKNMTLFCSIFYCSKTGFHSYSLLSLERWITAESSEAEQATYFCCFTSKGSLIWNFLLLPSRQNMNQKLIPEWLVNFLVKLLGVSRKKQLLQIKQAWYVKNILEWGKLMFSIHFRSLIFLSQAILEQMFFASKQLPIENDFDVVDWLKAFYKHCHSNPFSFSRYSQNIVFNLLPPSENFKLWFLGEAARAFLEYF